MLFLSIMFSSLSYSQTVKTVFTIGSSYTPGSCYPATPNPILPPAGVDANNTNNLSTNLSNSYLITTNNVGNLTTVIANAYARGYKHFYFQEGLYVISSPINLDGLYGITIEGAGAGTVFKPANTALEAIFKISNNYNSKIINIGIDLKTTVTCGTSTNGSGQDPNDANTGIKIGAQVGRCLFEGIYFRSNIAGNATVKGTSPILVELTAGQGIIDKQTLINNGNIVETN